MRMLRVLISGLLLGALTTIAVPALADTLTAPAAPTGVEGTVAHSTLTITWQALDPTASAASAPNAYTVTEEPSGTITTIQAPASSMSIDLGTAGYTWGTSFSLVATNEAGASPAVAVPISTGPGVVIVQPTPPTVTAANNGGRADVITIRDPAADGTTIAFTINGRSYRRVVQNDVATVVIKDANGAKRTRYVVKIDHVVQVLHVR